MKRMMYLAAMALLACVQMAAQERVNETYSPDSSRVAFTRANDLWVADAATGVETRLTFDGSDVILNGYASWIYYEEIFGRPSRYRAFWWSPDSKKIAFYRFDNTHVPIFPIYSPFAEDHDRSGMNWNYSQNAGAAVPLAGMSPTGGSVRMTRYPKCGDPNPTVRIGIVDLESGIGGGSSGFSAKNAPKPETSSRLGSEIQKPETSGRLGSEIPKPETSSRLGSEIQKPETSGGVRTVWADFEEQEDQYFGTPFWGADSKAFFVQREPRVQNTLDLYAVSPVDGTKTHIYHETYKTWLDWLSGIEFGEKGLYMVRAFETGWQQIYYLSYDGSVCKRLTEGENWRVSLLRVDEGKAVASKRFDGTRAAVYFTGERDRNHVRTGLFKAVGGKVIPLTDPLLGVSRVEFAPDGKTCTALLSNFTTPYQTWEIDLLRPSRSHKVTDTAPEGFDPGEYALPKLVTLTTSDGLELPAFIVYPKDFDPARRYPVHMDVYGGPDSPEVRDCFYGLHAFGWYADHGIIEITADCRAAGHNGRAGMDMIYRHLGELETRDFVEWAQWLKSLPYVQGDKIGVEGYSFGGTMTALLLLDHSDAFHYGIGSAGVYDWQLYDTHYTERFMDTPQRNPDGYARTRVIAHAKNYPVTEANFDGTVMLKLTHGTGDDNVHFQHSLKLLDALQQEGKKFELMVYPDGMHGYRGYQGSHFVVANRAFWLKYLKGK